jgi:hypothetical protein
MVVEREKVDIEASMGEELYDTQRAFILAQRENCEKSKPPRRHSCERTAARITAARFQVCA